MTDESSIQVCDVVSVLPRIIYNWTHKSKL